MKQSRSLLKADYDTLGLLLNTSNVSQSVSSKLRDASFEDASIDIFPWNFFWLFPAITCILDVNSQTVRHAFHLNHRLRIRSRARVIAASHREPLMWDLARRNFFPFHITETRYIHISPIHPETYSFKSPSLDLSRNPFLFAPRFFPSFFLPHRPS